MNSSTVRGLASAYLADEYCLARRRRRRVFACFDVILITDMAHAHDFSCCCNPALGHSATTRQWHIIVDNTSLQTSTKDSICLTMSLASTPFFSPSTSFQSLCLWLVFYCSYSHLLPLMTHHLTIHDSLTRSLRFKTDKLASFTILSHQTPFQPPRTSWPDRFF